MPTCCTGCSTPPERRCSVRPLRGRVWRSPPTCEHEPIHAPCRPSGGPVRPCGAILRGLWSRASVRDGGRLDLVHHAQVGDALDPLVPVVLGAFAEVGVEHLLPDPGVIGIAQEVDHVPVREHDPVAVDREGQANYRDVICRHGAWLLLGLLRGLPGAAYGPGGGFGCHGPTTYKSRPGGGSCGAVGLCGLGHACQWASPSSSEAPWASRSRMAVAS